MNVASRRRTVGGWGVPSGGCRSYLPLWSGDRRGEYRSERAASECDCL
jgi:hypothetical protein